MSKDKLEYCSVTERANGKIAVSYTLTKLHPGVARWMPTRLHVGPGPHVWRELREEIPVVFTAYAAAVEWASRVNQEIWEAIEANEMALVVIWEREDEYLHGTNPE